MKEVNFKALMHCGMYVDASLLGKGIYACEKPFIYSKEETIESLVEKTLRVMESLDNKYFSDKHLENLKQCQLVPILIVEAYDN